MMMLTGLVVMAVTSVGGSPGTEVRVGESTNALNLQNYRKRPVENSGVSNCKSNLKNCLKLNLSEPFILVEMLWNQRSWSFGQELGNNRVSHGRRRDPPNFYPKACFHLPKTLASIRTLL